MALYDAPPHSVTIQTPTTARDAGGGQTITYTASQSGVACSINTADASTREQFAQQGIFVSHTIAFLASALTSIPGRGVRVVTDDRSQTFGVEGVSYGRAYGGIPALLYLHCSEQL